MNRSIIVAVGLLGSLAACNKSPSPGPVGAPGASGVSGAPASQPASQPTTAPAAATATQAATSTHAGLSPEWGGGTVHRGAPFELKTETALADVLAAPKKFGATPIRTVGNVARSCSKKGCWMELQTADGGPGVRVSFKDYGFFVPLDSQGATAIVEGSVEVKTLSKEDAEHLEGEGARVARTADGSAVELAMVATGVELTKKR